MILQGNAVIAQGGGPTAVINQSLVGAVLEMKKYKEIRGIYGALHGVSGIINEEFLDLNCETRESLEEVANTPCSALFSTRDKPTEEYCARIFKVFKKYDIRYFFYIGGNDSSDTVRIVSEYAKKEKYDFRAFHIPKTIDNDLVLNDHTPGFGSAAKFVAEAFMGVNLETRALNGIYLGVVMGRHAGFLTAAASLGKERADDGPHLIYMPERAFSLEQFLEDIREVYQRLGRCVIAVSEGIVDEKGETIGAKLKEKVTRDAHGNVELAGGELGDMLVKSIKEHLQISRVRADTFGYLQRSYRGTVSEVDQVEAREAGAKAVQFAMEGTKKSGSVVLVRNSESEYGISYELKELEEIAAKTKVMPKEFINEKGNNVTEAFSEYALPLIGENIQKVGFLKSPLINKK